MQLSVGIFCLALEEIRTSNAASARHTNSVRQGVVLVNLLTGSIRAFEGNGCFAINNTYRVVGNGGQHRRKFYFFRRHCLIFGENWNQLALGVVQANASPARPSHVVVDIRVHFLAVGALSVTIYCWKIFHKKILVFCIFLFSIYKNRPTHRLQKFRAPVCLDFFVAFNKPSRMERKTRSGKISVDPVDPPAPKVSCMETKSNEANFSRKLISETGPQEKVGNSRSCSQCRACCCGFYEKKHTRAK